MEQEQALIGTDQLAAMICVKRETIYTQIYRNPASLPPRIVVPAARRKLLWARRDVEAWLDALPRTV